MGILRIAAGTARGRRLIAPKGSSVRPTSDRVRQAIFNILGQFFQGERVLDLFAGTGAMGLEALSRGAGRATFVEQDATAVRAIEANIRALGWEDRTRVVRGEVAAFLRGAREAPFDLVFLDPPYELSPEVHLESLGALGLAEGARVAVEHGAEWSPAARYGNLERWESRRYGATFVTLFEAGSEEAP